MLKIPVIIIMVLVFMAGCSGDRGDIIEVRERMFMGQVNEIYRNADYYLGKTIKLEGILKRHREGGDIFHYVVRNGPGCCGDDGGMIGFEVKWTGNHDFPEPESWVEAIGVLQNHRVTDHYSYLYLDLTSLTALNRRGQEFVIQ